MSNMNSRMRRRVYAHLKKIFGAYCQGCHALETEKKLVIDHKDNNNSNNNLDNLQFLCRSCNYRKNPRLKERPLDMCVGEKVEEFDLFSKPTEISINREKEPMFVEYVFQKVSMNRMIDEKELINSGSYRIGISQKTAVRYMDKICSDDGEFKRHKTGKKRMICLRNLSELSRKVELIKIN